MTIADRTTAPRTRLDLEAAFDRVATRHAELSAQEDMILCRQDDSRGPLPLDIHFKLDNLRAELSNSERELDALGRELTLAKRQPDPIRCAALGCGELLEHPGTCLAHSYQLQPTLTATQDARYCITDSGRAVVLIFKLKQLYPTLTPSQQAAVRAQVADLLDGASDTPPVARMPLVGRISA